jgi:hypothetical protein
VSLSLPLSLWSQEVSLSLSLSLSLFRETTSSWEMETVFLETSNSSVFSIPDEVLRIKCTHGAGVSKASLLSLFFLILLHHLSFDL